MVKLTGKAKAKFLAKMKKGKKDAAKKNGGGKKNSKKVRRLTDPDTIIGVNFGKLKKSSGKKWTTLGVKK